MEDHVTLKTGVVADENSALLHRNKLHKNTPPAGKVFLNSKIFNVFKKSFLLTKPAFIWNM